MCHRTNYTYQHIILRWFYHIIVYIPNKKSIHIFVNTSFWFDSGFKTVTTSLDTHDGLALGWDITHPIIYSINIFAIVLYLEQTLIAFRVKFSMSNIHALIISPLITKLRSALLPRLVYFITCLIVGSKREYLKTSFYILSLSP